MKDEDNLLSALLIDDNLMSSMRIQSQLRALNYDVKIARILTDDCAPQLVLVNIGSRGFDGVELSKSAMEKWPQSRVIGFCGHKEIEIRQRAKAIGMKRILTNDEALMRLSEVL